MASNTPMNENRVALYPVWPYAIESLEANGGKLNKSQIIYTDDERLMVGRGLGEDDPQPLEFWNHERLLKEISKLHCGLVVSGNTSSINGGTVGLSFAGAKSAFTDETITGYEVTKKGGEAVTVPAETDQTSTHAVTVSGAIGDENVFSVVALDSFGNRYQPVEFIVTIAANNPPDVAGVSVTGIPAEVQQNSEFTFNVDGAVDADGDNVTYYATSSPINIIALANVEGAESGQDIAATVGSVDEDVTVNVRVFADDGNGGVSEVTTTNVSVSANKRPVGNITIDLPDTLTRGETYSLSVSGATDPDGDDLTYFLINLVGCTVGDYVSDSANSGVFSGFKVNNDADELSFIVSAMDSEGEVSEGTTVTRSGDSVVSPTGSSGELGAGNHTVTVGPGVELVTITGNGGAGRASYSTLGSWNGCWVGERGTPGYYWETRCTYIPGVTKPAYSGDDTTISGEGIDHVFNGSGTGVTSIPVESSVIKTLDPSQENVITVNVAANGGTARIEW